VRTAYIDTSCLVAIAFGATGGTALARRLRQFDGVFSSNLLEAELRASFVREDVEFEDAILDPITWVLPDRPLTDEIARVLSTAYLRGADLWHVACALYLAGDRAGLAFVTLDSRQAEVAETLGFET